MPGLAELAAVLVCGGSALAAVNRDRLLAILGIAVALLAAPLVGARAPDLLSLAFREVAVLTGMYLLWISTARDAGGTRPDGSRDAPVFPAVIVILAFVGVLALAAMLGSQRGPVAALAAAASAGIAALALGSIGADLLAGGLSAILLVLSASLAVAGLGGVSGPLEHAVIGATLLAVSTAAAFLGSAEPRAAAAATSGQAARAEEVRLESSEPESPGPESSEPESPEPESHEPGASATEASRPEAPPAEPPGLLERPGG